MEYSAGWGTVLGISGKNSPKTLLGSFYKNSYPREKSISNPNTYRFSVREPPRDLASRLPSIVQITLYGVPMHFPVVAKSPDKNLPMHFDLEPGAGPILSRRSQKFRSEKNEQEEMKRGRHVSFWLLISA